MATLREELIDKVMDLRLQLLSAGENGDHVEQFRNLCLDASELAWQIECLFRPSDHHTADKPF